VPPRCRAILGKAGRDFPKAKLLGLTATPERLDGRGLKDWFEHMIVGPDTSTLIDEGYLSKFKMFAPDIPDLRGVRVKQREYDRRDLEAAMTKSTLVGDIVDHFKEKLAPNARALAFCVSVDASRELAARFAKAGIPAKHVDWETPQGIRDQAVADLASGKLRVLTNVEVFTEGFDLPAIDAVLLLRPTKSFVLYRQMIGRCLRVARGKTHTIILDHAGLAYEHGLPDANVEWSLYGPRSGAAKSQIFPGGYELRRCPECSAVHKWSAKCPGCSYVYQVKDRTIEEVYGEMREITQGAEYESQNRFARRCKLSSVTIARYVKQKKLGAYGPRRLIKIDEGLARVEWLRENVAGSSNVPPFGVDSTRYETQADFAKRVGADRRSGIQHLSRRGLPKAKNGWVCIEGGLEWLKREGLLDKDGMYIYQSPRSTPGFDTQTSFGKRIGVEVHTISRLIDEGLPINEHRLIPVEGGLEWLKREGLLTSDGEYINPQPQSTPGFDNRLGFAKRLGVGVRTINKLIDEGLPINNLRLIPVDVALQWLRREGLLTTDGEYISQKPRSTPGFDTRRSFAKRIGVAKATINRLIDEGLPINESNLIPVDDGLRWVKENRPQHQPNQGTAGENRAVREAAE
jgi:Helicase conserved C-terminal domain